MKKKIVFIILSLFMIFAVSNSNISANSGILSPTIVKVHNKSIDLPKQFYQEKGAPTYFLTDEEGTIIDEIYDFRAYFEILDNAVTILDMHQNFFDEETQTSLPIDKGGYTWDLGGFNLEELGFYTITITYDGVSSVESASITVEVIEEDVTPPVINYYGNYKLNISKTEEQFLAVFTDFLYNFKVFDNADGIIKITLDNFDEEEITTLRAAGLKDKITLNIEVEDEAGNLQQFSVTLEIIDNLSPNILNVKTLVTRKNKRIKDVLAHLEFFDNYTETEDIVIIDTYYGTLVQQNNWKKAARREKEDKGDLIDKYLRTTNIDTFFSYIKEKEKIRGFGKGDYYIVNMDDGKYYVYIEDKVAVEGSEIKENIWDMHGPRDDANFMPSGKLIEEYNLFPHADSDAFMAWLNTEKREGFNRYDYYHVRDVTAGSEYYVFITIKERIYEDEQGGIDFTRAGVQYVKVVAKDEFGNQATVIFRVVIEDSISLGKIVLFANLILLVGTGVIVSLVYVKPMLKNRKKEGVE